MNTANKKDAPAAGKGDPECRDCGAPLFYACVGCSATNYPPPAGEVSDSLLEVALQAAAAEHARTPYPIPPGYEPVKRQMRAGLEAALTRQPVAGDGTVPDEVVRQQESLYNPATQVFFRAGLIACREYMARFVQAESPSIAESIRANWWPQLGPDLGQPRQIEWSELTDGEFGTDTFSVKPAAEVSPTLEALPIALQFLGPTGPAQGDGEVAS